MGLTRKIVVFPTTQFYAIVGTIIMAEDPFALSIPDILNDKSSATHGAREHLHRPGKIYMTEAEFYALNDNTQRICTSLPAVHLPVGAIAAAVDFFPDRYRGNIEKRRDYEQRQIVEGSLRFTLHSHVLCGVADQKEIYRGSDRFISMNRLAFEEVPDLGGLSLSGFFELVGCPLPEYMAVNLARVFHS